MGYNSPCTDNTSIPQCDTRHNHSIGTNPDIVTDVNGLNPMSLIPDQHILLHIAMHTAVDQNTRTDDDIIADGYGAACSDIGPTVDKNIVAELYSIGITKNNMRQDVCFSFTFHGILIKVAADFHIIFCCGKKRNLLLISVPGFGTSPNSGKSEFPPIFSDS